MDDIAVLHHLDRVQAFLRTLASAATAARQDALRVELGDGPDHELIEQRNRKSQVTVRGAVDHPFLDELGPYGPEACDFDSQRTGDVARVLNV
jgi:hypothetical protein